MSYHQVSQRIPKWLRPRVLYFETKISAAVSDFSASLPDGAHVLDAGAGECQYAGNFLRHRYTAVDLAVGDAAWDYSSLNAFADLAALPFADATFDACIHIVTLEHVAEPRTVVEEIFRTLRPGASVLLVVPQEWEVHQAPNDYFRYTRYGMRYLLDKAGFQSVHVLPVGGYFRLMSRRLLNGLQFFRGPWFLVAAIVAGPVALALPSLDSLDRDRNFTLGYICTARKPRHSSR